MSNFLQNLARRSAGLPLSISPAPSPVLQTGFDSGEGIEEVMLEETATIAPQAAPEPIEMPSSASTRAPMPAVEIKPEQRTASMPTLLRAPESESGTALTPILQTQPASEPALMAKAAARSLPLTTHVEEAHERGEPMVQQATTSVRPLTRVTNDSHVLTTTPPEPQTILSSQVFAQPTEDTPDAPPVDHAIRPARTERVDVFQLPKATPAAAQTPAPLPIHVRVGRIEVKGNAPSQPNPVNTSPTGFAAYQRLRRYRI